PGCGHTHRGEQEGRWSPRSATSPGPPASRSPPSPAPWQDRPSWPPAPGNGCAAPPRSSATSPTGPPASWSPAAASPTPWCCPSFALVLPVMQNSFYSLVCNGMQRGVLAAGLSAMIADTDEDTDAERQVLDQLSAVSHRLILSSPRVSVGDLTDLAQRCAVVLINRELTGLASVVGNNADGIRQSVTHLFALGHRRIGYAGGPTTSWSDSR